MLQQRTEPPGLPARRIAADIIDAVLRRHRTLDELLDGASAQPGLATLADRDRALVRALVAVVLRRRGTLRQLIGLFLERGWPDPPRVETVLLIGAAQILWLDVPDHAAVDLAVRSARADRRAMHFSGLVNARCCAGSPAKAASASSRDRSTDRARYPGLAAGARWTAAYGAEHRWRRHRGAAHGQEPALDLTVKDDPARWAARARRWTRAADRLGADDRARSRSRR